MDLKIDKSTICLNVPFRMAITGNMGSGIHFLIIE